MKQQLQQREIKFRAWYNNIMYSIAFPSWNGNIIVWDNNKSQTKELILPPIAEDLPILLQYTGLKDSSENRIEIYRGDICKDKHDYTYLIDFRKGGFVAVHEPECRAEAERECKWDDLGCIYDEIEIIGNIYKNPELLKDNK